MLHGGALEILPIMPALCSMLFNAYYAGIIGASLAGRLQTEMVQKHKSYFSVSKFIIVL